MSSGIHDTRQERIAEWAKAAFGEAEATDLVQRGMRLLEESIEAAQAVDMPIEMAHKLVDYVYGRPKGELGQELGGIGITLLCLAAAAGISADQCESTEAERVLSKSLEFWKERNARKNAAGLRAPGLEGK
jgi:NTP pyrophosphatase (non-canonical NTP hydrolase)